MAFDRRKMHFINGVVLTQAQEEERKKKAPKYKISSVGLIALTLGMVAATQPPRR